MKIIECSLRLYRIREYFITFVFFPYFFARDTSIDVIDGMGIMVRIEGVRLWHIAERKIGPDTIVNRSMKSIDVKLIWSNGIASALDRKVGIMIYLIYSTQIQFDQIVICQYIFSQHSQVLMLFNALIKIGRPSGIYSNYISMYSKCLPGDPHGCDPWIRISVAVTNVTVQHK